MMMIILLQQQFKQKFIFGVANAFVSRSNSIQYSKRLHQLFSTIDDKKSKIKNALPPPLEDPSSFPEWAYEPRDFFHYELIYQSKKSNARVGRIHTPHGVIDTPGYVAVATNGAIKGLDMRDADDAGQQLVFCNSYHLLLQPGPDVIEGKVNCWILSAV